MLTELLPPPAEPVTLDEAKQFLRIDHDAEDGFIRTLIQSARERLEAYLNSAMITRLFRVSVPAAVEVRLPRWPVIMVDAVRADDAPTSQFHADLRKRPSTVSVFATEWIEIDFTAGYGETPDDVPAPLRQALLLLVAHAYERREDPPVSMPLMVDALTLPYRVVGL